jgi:Carboxypeptidase regulatory-like domain
VFTEDSIGHFVEFGVQSGMGPSWQVQHLAIAIWRKMLRLTVALAQLVALPSLIACSCGPKPPPCQAYWESPMVFLGTVIDIVHMPDGHVGWSPSRARMRVDRVYKGVSEPTLTLYDDGMCDGPKLEVGEQYLMYTRRDENGEIPARGCTRSRHVKFAEEDLKYLEGLSNAPPTSRVYGRVASWPEGPGDKVPLPGATVTLVGPNETLTANADDRGQYSFDGLGPGKYSVSAKQPGFDMPLRDYGLFSADVVARGSAAIDVTLNKHWPGVIAGRLFRPDGTRAPAGIDLNLLRLEDEEYRLVIPAEALTDEHGEYAFRSVRPGRYKIVLHWCCYPTRQAPYAPIYWPAAVSEEGGSDIVVGMEPDAKRHDFQLPTEVKRRTMSGLVLLPDGKPAPGVEVWLLAGDDRHDGYDVADQIRTDSDGRFSFVVLQGFKYVVEVRLDEGGPGSNTVPVSLDDVRGPIVLRVERRTAQPF